jgi:hypothetical protein
MAFRLCRRKSYLSSLLWGWNNNNSNNNKSPHIVKNDESSVSSEQLVDNNNTTAFGLHALQQAAALGHPEAQLQFANALAAGCWPFVTPQPTIPKVINLDHNGQKQVAVSD